MLEDGRVDNRLIELYLLTLHLEGLGTAAGVDQVLQVLLQDLLQLVIESG